MWPVERALQVQSWQQSRQRERGRGRGRLQTASGIRLLQYALPLSLSAVLSVLVNKCAGNSYTLRLELS